MKPSLRGHSCRRGPRHAPADGKKNLSGCDPGHLHPGPTSPRTAYISQLVASLSQLNAGVTATVDTSQVSQHAGTQRRLYSGLEGIGDGRAVYTYSPGVGPGVQYPKDLGAAAVAIFFSFPPTSC